jgi:hypothetical protein
VARRNDKLYWSIYGNTVKKMSNLWKETRLSTPDEGRDCLCLIDWPTIGDIGSLEDPIFVVARYNSTLDRWSSGDIYFDVIPRCGVEKWAYCDDLFEVRNEPTKEITA